MKQKELVQGSNTAKHITIITYHMIPYTNIWGATQRMYFLAEQLLSENFNVTVIHAKYGYFDKYKKQINFESIPIAIKPTIIQKFQESLQSRNVRNKPTDIRSVNLWKLKIRKIIGQILKIIEKVFYNDFNLIGLISEFWIKEAKPVLRNVIKENNTRIVIISGPYFSIFKLAKYVKKKYPDLKVILDYRDPWNLLKKGSLITLHKEKTALKISDLHVFFSERFAKAMNKKYKQDGSKSIVVYNGYDNKIWDELNNEDKNLICKNEKMVISYVSSNITFSKKSSRNPSSLIKGLSESKHASKIILNLVGCIDEHQDESFHVDAIINYLPVIPHKEALKVLLNSDISVILHSDDNPSPYVVTGKLFDCIRSNSYILGIDNSLKTDYYKIITENNIGICCQNNSTQIRESIDKLFNLWELDKLSISDNIDRIKFSRHYQNSIYIKAIENIGYYSAGSRHLRQ